MYPTQKSKGDDGGEDENADECQVRTIKLEDPFADFDRPQSNITGKRTCLVRAGRKRLSSLKMERNISQLLT